MGETLFEGIKIMMNNEKYPIEIRKHCIEKVAKSLSMIEGLKKKGRKYWSVFIRLYLNFVIGKTENIPKYFVYLHALELFLRSLTNRDKLEIWALFRSLSRKLPEKNMEDESDESQWTLYRKFRDKLKKEADKAQKMRNMDLDDEGLENFDQSQSQNMSQDIDINLNLNMNENKEENEAIAAIQRVSVAVSQLNKNKNVRVSVSRSSRKNHNDKEENEHDVDMKDIEDGDDDDEQQKSDENEENEESEQSEKGKVRRGGLGKRKKSTSQQSTSRNSGKWLKRKRNK